jgi:phosphatidylinositol-3-phosphatase
MQIALWITHKEVVMFRRSPKKSVRHWTLAAILWLVVLAFVFSPASVGVKADDGDDGGGLGHVFVIMMENTGFNTLIGNPNAPFTNYLAATAGLAINYFGVTHPSQPNYIAATSGSTNGVTGDGDVTINVQNIVDQLESHHKSWKAYMQSLSV